MGLYTRTADITDRKEVNMNNIGKSIQLMLLATGLLLMVAACGGAGSPSATFNGDECTYTGPDSVGTTDIEVSFENKSDENAALAFLALIDESARADEVALIGTRNSVGGADPEGATELAGILQAEPGETVTQTAPLTPGTYLLDCVTFSAGGPDEVWRVAVLEVEK